MKSRLQIRRAKIGFSELNLHVCAVGAQSCGLFELGSRGRKFVLRDIDSAKRGMRRGIERFRGNLLLGCGRCFFVFFLIEQRDAQQVVYGLVLRVSFDLLAEGCFCVGELAELELRKAKTLPQVGLFAIELLDAAEKFKGICKFTVLQSRSVR